MPFGSDPLTAWKRPRVRVGAGPWPNATPKGSIYSVGNAHAAVGDSPLHLVNECRRNPPTHAIPSLRYLRPKIHPAEPVHHFSKAQNLRHEVRWVLVSPDLVNLQLPLLHLRLEP